MGLPFSKDAFFGIKVTYLCARGKVLFPPYTIPLAPPPSNISFPIRVEPSTPNLQKVEPVQERFPPMPTNRDLMSKYILATSPQVFRPPSTHRTPDEGNPKLITDDVVRSLNFLQLLLEDKNVQEVIWEKIDPSHKKGCGDTSW